MPIIGRDVLVFRGAPQHRQCFVEARRSQELGGLLDARDVPARAVSMPDDSMQSTGGSERAEILRAERRPLREVMNRSKRSSGARSDHSSAALLRQPFDVV